MQKITVCSNDENNCAERKVTRVPLNYVDIFAQLLCLVIL
jgi:hypothetical protein